MNIFVTDDSPTISAQNLDNERVVKMILESTQMLCTAINERGGTSPYKSTHVNHPSNVWARETQKNFLWLLKHAFALCSEYSRRYDKDHKCYNILKLIDQEDMYVYMPLGPLTPFANCAANQSKGISFKHVESPIEAYKQYLSARWDTDTIPPKWTGRPVPSFYKGIYAGN